MPPIPRGLEGRISQEQWQSLTDAQRANVIKHAGSYMGIQRDALDNNLNRWAQENKLLGERNEVQDLARGQVDEFGGSPFRAQQEKILGMYLDQAQGKNSVAGELLRQQTGRNIAQAQGMVASAAPQNQALAARSAILGSMQARQAMAGQASLAQLQERQAALSGASQAAFGARGQDIGAREFGISTLGEINENERRRQHEQQMEQARQPSRFQRDFSTASQVAAAGAQVFSDRRAKRDVAGGSSMADNFMDNLKAYTFQYKDKSMGQGKKLGVMAQDVEKSRLGKNAVKPGPGGVKMLDLKELVPALAASVAELNAKLDKMSKKKG